MTAAMLRSVLRRSTRSATASYYFSSRGISSEPAPERKVAILGAGAAGGIGQPLSLLMKLNPLVSRRALHDIAATPSVAADVSHINTRSEVKWYAVEAQLGQALDSATVSMPYAGAIINDACLKGLKGVPDVAVRLGKNGLEEVLGSGPRSDYVQQRSEALKPELKSSIENAVAGQMKSKSDTTTFSVEQPNKPTLRPLSPHLPIYKPQLSSTFSIYHRISGILLTTIILSYYLLCQKIGLVCLTYENVHQFFLYSSKLVPISLEITALALAYHVFHGIRHLLMK